MAVIDNLMAYWSLDEASGSAIDAHDDNDLAEFGGTIASTTGKVGNARDFELDDTEGFDLADNTDLSVQDIDFTIAGWVYLKSLPASTQMRFVDKADAGQMSYALLWYDSGASDRFEFAVSSTVNAGASLDVYVDATDFGLPAVDTWYFIVASHDAANNKLLISVNGGTVTETAHSGGVFDGTSAFHLGYNTSGGFHVDSLMDEFGFWKKVLSPSEITWLYNSGNGRSYADIEAEAGNTTISPPIGTLTLTGHVPNPAISGGGASAFPSHYYQMMGH